MPDSTDTIRGLSSARIRAIMASLEPDVPFQTWHMVCAWLGAGRAASLGPKAARHLCARAMEDAQRFGYIRKMPVKAPTSAPSRRFPRKVYKEAVWVITEKGMEFRDRVLKGDFPAGVRHPAKRVLNGGNQRRKP